MNKELRKKIRERIPHGDIKKIADDNEFSRQTLYNWFGGTHSPEVEKAVLSYLKDKKIEKEEQENLVSELINQ